jgi:hypothetical protein
MRFGRDTPSRLIEQRLHSLEESRELSLRQLLRGRAVNSWKYGHKRNERTQTETARSANVFPFVSVQSVPVRIINR